MVLFTFLDSPQVAQTYPTWYSRFIGFVVSELNHNLYKQHAVNVIYSVYGQT